MGLNQLNLAGD